MIYPAGLSSLTHSIQASFLVVQLEAPERLQQLTLSLPAYFNSTLGHPSNCAYLYISERGNLYAQTRTWNEWGNYS